MFKKPKKLEKASARHRLESIRVPTTEHSRTLLGKNLKLLAGANQKRWEIQTINFHEGDCATVSLPSWTPASRPANS